jgi:CRP/FNR family cyclic AMP-dependent transcriptional regulator
MQVQRVRDGQAIFREGDPGDAWYVIFEGQADVFKQDDFLPRRRIATLSSRACFGEMAILDHSPRSASVVAAGPCTVFRFPRPDFEQLLAHGNLAAYKLIYEMAKVLCARARDTSAQLSEALAAAAPDGLTTRAQQVVEHTSLSE